MSVVQVYEIPTEGPFVAVWEYNGNVFSNSFEQAGFDEEFGQVLLPYNIEYDCYRDDDKCTPFFLQYPHKLFISYKAVQDEAE